MKNKKIDTPYSMSPYSWEHISGEKYWEIYDILYDDTITDIDKQARLCCVIEGIDIDDFYKLPINEAGKKIAQLDFLNDFKIRHNYHPDFIYLGEYKCRIIAAETMNVAQFIDYQNFINLPFKENYDKLLSIFLIPEDKNYNEGYNINEIQSFIREMKWIDIQSLLNFIIVKYIKSLYHSLRYLTNRMKKMKGQEKQEMEKLLTDLKIKIRVLTDFHILL